MPRFSQMKAVTYVRNLCMAPKDVGNSAGCHKGSRQHLNSKKGRQRAQTPRRRKKKKTLRSLDQSARVRMRSRLPKKGNRALQSSKDEPFPCILVAPSVICAAQLRKIKRNADGLLCDHLPELLGVHDTGEARLSDSNDGHSHSRQQRSAAR